MIKVGGIPPISKKYKKFPKKTNTIKLIGYYLLPLLTSVGLLDSNVTGVSAEVP
jgi:hypothetical protein